MHFFGGKFRVRKQIGEFLNQEIAKGNYKGYIEPFCGGCWISTQIKPVIPIFCSDAHEDLMLMWKALQQNWLPPEFVGEQEYKDLRFAAPSALRGFVGFACSFSGKWWGGYARNNRGRSYSQDGRNSLLRKIKLLKHVRFNHLDYKRYDKANGYICYMDPPYSNTTPYKDTVFNHDEFYNWCRMMSKNNKVLVSEYSMPEDFKVVLEIKTRLDIRNAQGIMEPRIERVFTI